MKKVAIVILAVAAAALLWYGCCRGCGKGIINTDLIPGGKDSGIPDVHAAKEHEKEIEGLSKQIEALAEEQRKVAADPTLSAEEKQRRLEEINTKMQPLAQRMAELGGDILNKETEVNKDIEKWKKESGGK